MMALWITLGAVLNPVAILAHSVAVSASVGFLIKLYKKGKERLRTIRLELKKHIEKNMDQLLNKSGSPLVQKLARMQERGRKSRQRSTIAQREKEQSKKSTGHSQVNNKLNEKGSRASDFSLDTFNDQAIPKVAPAGGTTSSSINTSGESTGTSSSSSNKSMLNGSNASAGSTVFNGLIGMNSLNGMNGINGSLNGSLNGFTGGYPAAAAITSTSSTINATAAMSTALPATATTALGLLPQHHQFTQSVQRPKITPQLAFRLVDADGTGELSVEEFKTLLENMNIRISDTRALRMFAHADKEGSAGSITYDEFLTLWNSLLEHITNDALINTGLSTKMLLMSLSACLVTLILLFAFLFLSVNAFEGTGAFGSTVRSAMALLASKIGTAAGERGEVDISQVKAAAEKSLKVFVGKTKEQEKV
jgi:hypothetical protein